MDTTTRRTALIVLALAAFGFIVRLLPHLPDATPITAIAIASSLYLGRRSALIVPVATLFLSDLLIGLYDWRIMASVYGSFLVIGAVSYLSAKRPGILSNAIVIVFAALFFFLVTNFAVWAFSPWYEKSLQGLLYCYALGLPFMRNMLVGDILYTTLILGFFRVLGLSRQYGAQRILGNAQGAAVRHTR